MKLARRLPPHHGRARFGLAVIMYLDEGREACGIYCRSDL